MKLWLISAALLTIGVLAGAQGDSAGGVHVDPAKVAAALAKGGSLVTRPDLLVSGSHRDAAGKVEVHDKETDVLYVVDGEATFVFGGKMVGGKVTSARSVAGLGHHRRRDASHREGRSVRHSRGNPALVQRGPQVGQLLRRQGAEAVGAYTIPLIFFSAVGKPFSSGGLNTSSAIVR